MQMTGMTEKYVSPKRQTLNGQCNRKKNCYEKEGEDKNKNNFSIL